MGDGVGRLVRTGVVTYPILASIVAGGAALIVWAFEQHRDAGHPRHDAQVINISEQVTSRLSEHSSYESDRYANIQAAIQRIERKQDLDLKRQGVVLPDDLQYAPFVTKPDPLRRAIDAGVPQ